MKLNDRFNVIIPYSFSKNKIDINCFFENLIKNNTRIYISSFVKNQINTNDSNIDKIISIHLNDYIKQLRKNIRQMIRKDSLNINLCQIMINILNEFSYKILELEYYSNTEDNINIYYNNLLYNIIGDPLLKDVLRENIMDYDNIKNTKHLFSKIKNLKTDFYSNWCIPFMSNIFEDYLLEINNLEYPIQDNIVNIIKFNKKIIFLEKAKKNFDFINNNRMFSSVYNNIIESLFLASDTNSINTMNIMLEKYHKTIILILSDTSNLKRNSQIALIIKNIFEKYLKTETLDDILSMYIIIKRYYSNSINCIVPVLNRLLCRHINENNMFEELINIIFEKIEIFNQSNKDDIILISSLLTNFDDKNIFTKKYHKELMSRLLSEDTTLDNVINERTILNSLTKNIFGNKNIYKLNKTIDDMEDSIKKNLYIKVKLDENSSINIKNWNIVTTSYNIWDTTMLDIASNFKLSYKPVGQLSQFIVIYSMMYSEMKQNNEFLNWYLHTGSVDFKYKTNQGFVKLTLLPLQALALEIFDKKDIVNLSELLCFESLSSYSKKEKDKILNIFFRRKILFLKGYKLIFNMNLKSCELNLIDDFFQISSLPQKWEKDREKEIANNKEDIVKTKINHNLKHNQMTLEELFEKCCDINVFKLDRNLFDRMVEYMIKMDYIEKDNINGLYKKLLY